MGYGDIYPVTTVGRFVTMLSSVFGIAIVALPSGIITAGYMKALADLDEDVDHIDYNTKYLKTKKLKKLNKEEENSK
jgi:voltage-gated potassium channel